MSVHGASPLPLLRGAVNRAGIAHAGMVTTIYLMSLTGFFAMYYGLQWAEYG